jgi:hypothetical protein
MNAAELLPATRELVDQPPRAARLALKFARTEVLGKGKRV